MAARNRMPTFTVELRTRAMAENEALDLTSRQARRWRDVIDVARRGGSQRDVVSITRKKFYGAFRKVIRQFKSYGITVADFLDVRASPNKLRGLLRLTKGHRYAQLLGSILNSNPDLGGTECLEKWGHGALDEVFDQITHILAGTESFPGLPEAQRFFRHVGEALEGDIKRIARILSVNPGWEPRQAPTKGAKSMDVTAELLPMSLLAGSPR
jgi:hypothetical protein